MISLLNNSNITFCSKIPSKIEGATIKDFTKAVNTVAKETGKKPVTAKELVKRNKGLFNKTRVTTEGAQAIEREYCAATGDVFVKNLIEKVRKCPDGDLSRLI